MKLAALALLLPSYAASLGAVFTVSSDAHGLAVDVSNITLAAPANLTFSWARLDRAAGGVVAVSRAFGAGAAPTTRLARFSPGQAYAIEIADARSGAALQAANVTAGLTGVAELDAPSPLAELVSGAPRFELLAFDRGGPVVVVDREGWVVAYFASAGGVVDQLGAAGGFDLVSLALEGTTRAADGLVELTSADAVVRRTPNATASFAALSHEARADRAAPPRGARDAELVLSLQAQTRAVAGLAAPQRGDRLVAWNRTDGALVVLADAFDYFDPVTDFGACSGRGDDEPCGPPLARLADAAAAADDDEAAQDWTHANSATRSADGLTYLVSLRHLSCVVAFRADGGGVSWVLSGEGVRPSLAPAGSYVFFRYDADASRQYNQHCARQLENGNVLLFDNGDARPAAAAGAPRFSRAAEYALDFASATATLVWSFTPALNATSAAYSFHAGAVSRVDGGGGEAARVLAAFSCDSALAGDACTHMVYEAERAPGGGAGRELARVRVPALGASAAREAAARLPRWLAAEANGAETGGYRAIALETIDGESRAD